MKHLGTIRRVLRAVTPGWARRELRRLIWPAPYRHLRRLVRKPKIIYALTPHPQLKNIGDHAQALAIPQWFAEHFPGLPVVEFDKKEVLRFPWLIAKLARPRDIVFLHSGGNMGDRARLSESGRRLLIQRLRRNRIVSLPQTICFSDTDAGRAELEETRRIYNGHPDLTIVARDEESHRLALDYFPQCKVLCCPDFVLYLQPPPRTEEPRRGVLLCLRNDKESVLDAAQRKLLAGTIEAHGFRSNTYDTTLDHPISRERRAEELRHALSEFGRHALVVTDRFHGIIFSVLAGVPVVALPTCDHKLRASVGWFRSLPWVRFASELDEVGSHLAELAGMSCEQTIDWRGLHFDRLAEEIA